MQMTEIRKQTLTELATPSLVAELAESAKAVLGYDILAKMQTVVVESELHTALKSLEIEVLNEADVKLYMRERLIEQTTLNLRKWMEEKATKKSDEYDFLSRFDGPGWRHTKIAEYKQPVPEHVLAKAVQIKQAVPQCEVWVYDLQDHPDPFLAVSLKEGKYSWEQPEDLLFVEVWAEPKFEGKL